MVTWLRVGLRGEINQSHEHKKSNRYTHCVSFKGFVNVGIEFQMFYRLASKLLFRELVVRNNVNTLEKLYPLFQNFFS